MKHIVVVYATINRNAQVEYNYYFADCGFTPIGLKLPYVIRVTARSGL